MSLPSYAVYYNKQNQEIYKHFVNIGWFVSEETWVGVALSLPNFYQVANIRLYDIKFDGKLLGNEQALISVYKNNMPPVSSIVTDNLPLSIDLNNQDVKLMLGNIRKIMPALIAEDIISVQPMFSSHGQIFTIKPPKYQSVVARKIQDKYSNWKIYIKSVIQYVSNKLGV